MKVFKLNKTGGIGVTIPQPLKDDGFVAGVKIEWLKENGRWYLYKSLAAPNKPQEAKAEETTPLPLSVG